MIKIKNWKTGEVIHSGDFDTVKACLEDGVARGVNFSYADLSNANLRHVDFSNADLSYADLSNADFSYAVLSDADLSYADFSDADLSGANFSYANFSNADFGNADLSYAVLSNANSSNADFSNANLRNAEGILSFKAKESGRMFSFVDGEEIKVKAGCFWGTIQELKNRIKSEGKEESHKDYLLACDWAEWSFKR